MVFRYSAGTNVPFFFFQVQTIANTCAHLFKVRLVSRVELNVHCVIYQCRNVSLMLTATPSSLTENNGS